MINPIQISENDDMMFGYETVCYARVYVYILRSYPYALHVRHNDMYDDLRQLVCIYVSCVVDRGLAS